MKRANSIIEIFKKQVMESPNNVGLVTDFSNYSYDEIDKNSDKVADELLRNNVVKGDFISVIMHRSEKMLFAILGILKVGAVYVPISREFPEERTDYILKDTDSKIVIVDGDINLNNTIFTLVANDDFFKRELNSKVSIPLINGDDPLYCIYTSGTTGVPKGVVNTNLGCINRISWMQEEYPINNNDRILQKTNYIFDVSVWELFWWFFTGASCVLLEDGEQGNPEKIYRKIIEEKITVTHFVPTMLSEYLNYLEDNSIEDSSNLKWIFSSGEPLLPEYSSRFYKLSKGTLVNLYGPTEASIDVTHYKVSGEESQIPIGVPIKNMQVVIADPKTLKICDEGKKGEIFILGVGLAKGYLNNPAKNAEAFLNNPFGTGRAYRTGDFGYVKNGLIYYVGRKDDQIKINGYRVDLNEILFHLKKFDSIDDVRIIYTKEVVNTLKVYFISKEKIEEESIRNYLQTKLPMYMIPHKFINIESFPLTSNGKPDKKALINISNIAKSNLKAEEEEAILCTVCYKILKQELGDSLNLECSFVDNGGDSLRAMKVTSELKKNNYSASVRDLLKTKSLKDFITNTNLQDYVHNENKQSNIYTTLGTPIMQDFLKKDLPNSSHFCQAIVVDISKTSLATLLNGINYLIDRHDSLRLSITEEHNFKINLPGYRKYYFENQILKEQISQQIVDVISEKIISKINLEDNNLIAVEYVETPDTNYAFICIHHLLVDVVSWGIILQDLDDYICNQECDTSRSRLLKAIESINKLPVDEEEFNYWNQVTLAHKSNNFENYEFSQEIQKNYLKLEFSQDNLKVIQSNLKVEHFLLSLIVRCFAMISQKNNIQVMLEGHGRMFKDYLENVIDVVGWFTSEYPINFDVKRDLVAQCDEIERRMLAVPNNGLMYSKVKKSLSKVACPDILFNYLGDSFADTSWKVLKRTNYSINNMISDNNYQKSIFMVLLEKTDNAFEISITSDSQHYSLEFMEEFCKLVKQEFENFLS